MPYSITQARPLLTRAELELFEASRADALKRLTPARLQQKIARSRALRDKYRDLYRRQTRSSGRATAAGDQAARGRVSAAARNDRTQTKAEIFDQVLGRFEAAAAKAEAGAARPAGNKPMAAPHRKAAAPATISLTEAVRQAVEQRTPPPPPPRPGSAAARRHGAPASSLAAVARGVAPTDVPAAAEREDLLKAEPVQQKIHAAAAARNQRDQARRDGRD